MTPRSTFQGVEATPGTQQSRVRRFASTVYDAQAGGREPLLDGPWWLGLLLVVAVSVLTFGSSPWKWLVVPLLAAFFWLPFCVRWGSALWRSVISFREGFRS